MLAETFYDYIYINKTVYSTNLEPIEKMRKKVLNA